MWCPRWRSPAGGHRSTSIRRNIRHIAARPSGTEDVYKLYAESLRGEEHLREVQEEARAVVSAALGE